MMLRIYITHSSVVVVAILFIGGCGSYTGPEVCVELTYRSTSSSAKLYYANVISGGDKFHWYGIYSGKNEIISLHPGMHSNSQVTLFYQFEIDKPMHVWEGPEIQAGRGYRIHITIHDSGQIAEQTCILPCQMTF